MISDFGFFVKVNVKVNVKESCEFDDLVGPMILIGRQNGRITKLGRFNRAIRDNRPDQARSKRQNKWVFRRKVFGGR